MFSCFLVMHSLVCYIYVYQFVCVYIYIYIHTRTSMMSPWVGHLLGRLRSLRGQWGGQPGGGIELIPCWGRKGVSSRGEVCELEKDLGTSTFSQGNPHNLGSVHSRSVGLSFWEAPDASILLQVWQGRPDSKPEAASSVQDFHITFSSLFAWIRQAACVWGPEDIPCPPHNAEALCTVQLP